MYLLFFILFISNALARPFPLCLDNNLCMSCAGYSWCDPLNKCIRPWETNCTLI